MIANFLKVILKDLLRKTNRKLYYIPPTKVSGLDLYHDLKSTIGTDEPVCLDVGANRGQSIKSFQKVFKVPVIHSFEPSSEMFKVLQSRHFGENVFLYNTALGKEDEKKEFINYDNSTLSSFLPLDSSEENRFRAIAVKNKEFVDVTSVDSFLKKSGITRVDLLKIDTQGFDLEVLQGSLKALQAGVVKNVLIELNFVKIYEQQSNAIDILSTLRQHGMYLVGFYEKNYHQNVLAWCTALFRKM